MTEPYTPLPMWLTFEEVQDAYPGEFSAELLEELIRQQTIRRASFLAVDGEPYGGYVWKYYEPDLSWWVASQQPILGEDDEPLDPQPAFVSRQWATGRLGHFRLRGLTCFPGVRRGQDRFLRDEVMALPARSSKDYNQSTLEGAGF